MDKNFQKHQMAIVDSDKIGEKTRIWAFAHVMKEAIIGTNCNIGECCYIENDVKIGNGVTLKNGVAIWDKVTIEDEVFIGPYAVFTNDMNPRASIKKPPSEFLPTLIKRWASIGANATIVCGVTIGTGAFVGAGSVVIKDVPDFAMVVGNPARQIGYMCVCGQKINFKKTCNCGRKYLLSDHKCQIVENI